MFYYSHFYYIELSSYCSVLEQVSSFVKIFPGTTHGWTVRYDVNDEPAVKKAEEAHNDMLEWFVKHVN